MNRSNWLAKVIAGSGRYRVLRSFVLAGLFAGVVVFAVTGKVLSDALVNRMVNRDAEVSQAFVQALVNSSGVVGHFAGDRNEDSQERFEEFFRNVSALPDVIRTHLFATDLKVMASTRVEMVGHPHGRNGELDRALAGETVSALVPAPTKQEHRFFAPDTSMLLENYIPVTDPRSGRVIGVVEFYRSPVALWEAIHRMRQLVWLCAGGGAIFLFAVLLSLIRQTDRLILRQQTELAEARSATVLSELSGAIAHSIRNPLASIRSTSELECLSPSSGPQAHEDIIRQVDRIDALVTSLLSYNSGQTRMRAPISETVDPARVIRSATEAFARQFDERGTQLQVQVDRLLPSVRGDGVLLEQAVNSLLSNAFEATAAGDTVRVTADKEPETGRVVITVSDTGRGFDPGDLRRAFRPFFTTKPQGMGVGLALVRRIVRMLDGEIRLNSTPGQGTVVTLELPEAGA